MERDLKKENRLLRIALAVMALTTVISILNGWRAENRYEERLEKALQSCTQQNK